MNKNTKKKIWYWVVGLAVAAAITLGFKVFAAPSDYGLKEGDVIRASNDIDVFIVNDFMYKRLFTNPQIFNVYGHLGFDKVKVVTPATRDSFVTSGLFRNCESNSPKVYGLEVVGEDGAVLHWVNTSGAQAVADDPNFFKKVFCINNAEQALYTIGADYTSVSQVPAYSRGGEVVSVNNAVINRVIPSETIINNAKRFTMLDVRFNGNGIVNSLTVKKLGFGSKDDYEGIYLYKDDVRLTDLKTFNSNNVIVFNNLNLQAPFVLSVVADFSGTPQNIAKVELSGDYNGLPLQSNNFTFAGVQSGKVEFTLGPDVDAVVTGNNALLGKFSASASVQEDVTIKQIELGISGSAKVTNLKLFVDDSYITGTIVGDKVVFNTNVVVKREKSKTFKIYGTISGDAGDNVKFTIKEPYDVYAIGNIYGFGVETKVSGSTGTTVAISGELTVKKITTEKQAVIFGETNRNILGFKFTSKNEPFLITDLKFGVESSLVDKVSLYADGVLVDSADVDIDNVSFSDISVKVDGTKEFVLKANFKSQEDANVASGSFEPVLISYRDTAINSDKDSDEITVNLTGKSVFVYPSVVSVNSTLNSGSFSLNANKKVFAFKVTAVGGDVKIASGSPFVVLEVNSNGGLFTPSFILKQGATTVASGSLNLNGSTIITLDTNDESVVELSEGDSAEFTLYVNTTGFSGDDKYLSVAIDDIYGAISWFGKDDNGEYFVNSFKSEPGTINGLPIDPIEFN